MLQTCDLWNTTEKRDRWFNHFGNIVADGGFFSQLFPSIICPIASSKTNPALWNTLSAEEKEWSYRVSSIEIKIEHTFAQIFVHKFQLLKRAPKAMCYNAAAIHPQFILAASILYNMEILYHKRCIFDGPNPDSTCV